MFPTKSNPNFYVSPSMTHYDEKKYYPSNLLPYAVKQKVEAHWAHKPESSMLFNPDVQTGGARNYYYTNPNNQTTDLVKHQGQFYQSGSNKYYQNLDGKGSSQVMRDEVVGRTVFSSSGRPIILTTNDYRKPQIKFDDEAQNRLDWSRPDYTDVDHDMNKNSALARFKRLNDLPMQSDIKEYESVSCPHHYLPRKEETKILTSDKVKTWNEDIGNYGNSRIDSKHDTNVDKRIDTKFYKQPELILEDGRKGIPTFADGSKDVINNTYRILEEKFTQNNIEFKNFVSDLQHTLKEGYVASNDREMKHTDDLYKSILRSYPQAIAFYLSHSKYYSHWSENWKYLTRNLEKSDIKVERLPVDDDDIAYTQDKGDVMRFRFRDKKRWMPLSNYTYVLLHELTHNAFPDNFQGHGSPFPEMLCLVCVAAYELNLLQLDRVSKSMLYSNGQPICSRESLKKELNYGLDMLESVNTTDDDREYYEALRKRINST